MRRKHGVVLGITLLVLALAPTAASAQDGGTEEGATEVIDLGESTLDPNPFGFCADSQCYVSEPGLTKDDVLATAPDAIFTDVEDPPGLVACFLGEGCQVLDASITPEDFEAVTKGNKGIVGAVDGDLTGTWSVTDHRTKMICRSGGKNAPIKIKRNQHEDTVERLDNGRLLLSSDGFAEVVSRLGPGVYGMTFKTKGGGTRVETRSFLAMQDDDTFQGISESDIKQKRGKCTMSRQFDGVRLSGPDIEIERLDVPDDGQPAEGEDGDTDPDAAQELELDALPDEDEGVSS